MQYTIHAIYFERIYVHSYVQNMLQGCVRYLIESRESKPVETAAGLGVYAAVEYDAQIRPPMMAEDRGRDIAQICGRVDAHLCTKRPAFTLANGVVTDE